MQNIFKSAQYLLNRGILSSPKLLKDSSECPAKAATKPHAKSLLFKKLSFFVAFPIILLVAATVITAKHEHERPPFVAYPYLALRQKRFCWGDGNHSFFHNPRINALPDGYEDE